MRRSGVRIKDWAHTQTLLKKTFSKPQNPQINSNKPCVKWPEKEGGENQMSRNRRSALAKKMGGIASSDESLSGYQMGDWLQDLSFSHLKPTWWPLTPPECLLCLMYLVVPPARTPASLPHNRHSDCRAILPSPPHFQCQEKAVAFLRFSTIIEPVTRN